MRLMDSLRENGLKLGDAVSVWFTAPGGFPRVVYLCRLDAWDPEGDFAVVALNPLEKNPCRVLVSKADICRVHRGLDWTPVEQKKLGGDAKV